jgi:hypothetical protein
MEERRSKRSQLEVNSFECYLASLASRSTLQVLLNGSRKYKKERDARKQLESCEVMGKKRRNDDFSLLP